MIKVEKNIYDIVMFINDRNRIVKQFEFLLISHVWLFINFVILYVANFMFNNCFIDVRIK